MEDRQESSCDVTGLSHSSFVPSREARPGEKTPGTQKDAVSRAGSADVTEAGLHPASTAHGGEQYQTFHILLVPEHSVIVSITIASPAKSRRPTYSRPPPMQHDTHVFGQWQSEGKVSEGI